jgi:hypothetical protein
VSVRVVDPFEVVQVDQQHRADAALTDHSGVRLGQAILEERPVREPGERVVECLVGQLGREQSLLSDVTFREDEIEDLPGGVARRRSRHFDFDYPSVLS